MTPITVTEEAMQEIKEALEKLGVADSEDDQLLEFIVNCIGDAYQKGYTDGMRNRRRQ